VRKQAGEAVGADEVELVRLARVRGSTLLALAGGILALVVLLPQMTTLADAGKAMADADWPWLLPVLLCVALGYVATTATFRAAAPVRPPFGLSYLNQLAAATLNRVTPNGIGGLGTNIRFLQRSGYDTTDAGTIMALVSLNGAVAGAFLIAVFVVWAGQSGAAFPWPSDSVMFVAVGAVLGLLGIVLAIPALRRFAGDKLGPIAHKAWVGVRELLTDPRRCAVMQFGSIGNSLLQLASLWFVLHAFGTSVGIAAMGAVLFGGKALAGAAPTPGGVGAVEAALIGGLSGAGVDPAVATPAVLVFRLLTNWLVVIPGWFALRTLRARHAL
jgi:undecaprenyl-diphosphatase